MNQFDQSVEKVVAFLREQKYTASTVCAHKKCYSELRMHLTGAGLGYSFETELDWIKQESVRWGRRKSANYRYFIVHLDDMDRLGGISDFLKMRIKHGCYRSLDGPSVKSHLACPTDEPNAMSEKNDWERFYKDAE